METAGGGNARDGRDEDEVTDPVWIVRKSINQSAALDGAPRGVRSRDIPIHSS
jgi:hypothetical protein